MKLLATYEDKDEAEIALTKISGEKRLASERDSTVVIYNLFGEPTWGNFYKLDMFRLKELQTIVELGVRLEKGNYPTLSAFFAQMATD